MMDIFDIFWLICKIAIAFAMFVAVCVGIYFLVGSFLHWRLKWAIHNKRIENNRAWLLSLDRVRLLLLTTEEGTGFDKQDKNDLISIADNTYSDKEKLIVVDRLAERLNRQFKY